jgi:hypothetical protein
MYYHEPEITCPHCLGAIKGLDQPIATIPEGSKRIVSWIEGGGSKVWGPGDYQVRAERMRRTDGHHACLAGPTGYLIDNRGHTALLCLVVEKYGVTVS